MKRSNLFDTIPWIITLICVVGIARESWRKLHSRTPVAVKVAAPIDPLPVPDRALHPSMQSWYSSTCQNFYKRPLIEKTGAYALSSGPSAATTAVAEDEFYLGRAFATDQVHPANEVTISTEHRFVYVEVRKAASSSIRKLLQRHFNATWRCPGPAAARRPGCLAFDRCSTLCLTPEELDGYFFFSMVRDPLSRFFSGFKQAASQKGIRNVTLEHMTGILQTAVASSYYWDPHLETQAFSLSSPVVTPTGGAASVPLHFLGRTESFQADFTELLGILKARSESRGVDFPELNSTDINLTANVGGLKTALVRRVGDEGVEALVRRAYAQDFACFGY
jgi:hypothetical protein